VTGPRGTFAVVALALQVSALAALLAADRCPAVVLAMATGRVTFAWCVQRRAPPARPDGLVCRLTRGRRTRPL
jgi:hypothetical protein